MELILVVAVAKNGVIGADGDIPWHYPEDLRHFKETTMGHPVIMGRETYESIETRLDGPLPGRTNIVLSRGTPQLPAGVVHARGIEEALEAARETGSSKAFVVGGASVYEQFLPRADRVVLTEIPDEPAGDTHFPELGDDWTEVSREKRGPLDVVEYAR